MKPIILEWVVSIALIMGVSFSAAAHSSKHDVRAPAGAMIEGVGLAIDASYDLRLDDLVPGYRVINVVLVNNSFNVIMFNPDKDRWSIRAGKKTYKAIIDLKSHDPDAWEKIPDRARKMITYPLAVPIGARLVLDLFFPDSTPVEKMTELIVQLATFESTLSIFIRD